MSAQDIEKHIFDSGKDGKTLVVFGAVHGNEKCGTLAIRRAIDEGLKPDSGKIIYIPICNPKAYEENVRFIDRNLNRYLYPKDVQEHYEDSLDPVLCETLDEADFLLDLHSYESQGKAFIFLGESKEENDFALALGVHDFVYGWAEAFSSSSEKGSLEGMGTTEYTRSKNGKAITLECGHHANEDAAEVGYAAIKNALAYVVTGEREVRAADDNRIVKMQTVFYKEREGSWTKPWKHYDEVKAGDILASYDDGEDIIAPEDGFIVLPKATPKLGGEWFYFGIGTAFPE